MMTLILYIFTRAIKNARVRKIKDYYSNPRGFDRDPHNAPSRTENIYLVQNVWVPFGTVIQHIWIRVKTSGITVVILDFFHVCNF